MVPQRSLAALASCGHVCVGSVIMHALVSGWHAGKEEGKVEKCGRIRSPASINLVYYYDFRLARHSRQ